MNRVVLLFICMMFPIQFARGMDLAVKKQSNGRKADPRDENFYWLLVGDDNCKEFKILTNISREADNYMGWFARRDREKGVRRENRLVIPITISQWKRIKRCFKVIRKQDYEKLRLEILDELGIREFADLLLYASFLEFDALLKHGGKEFIDQFKRDNITDFTLRGTSYLSSCIFVARDTEDSKVNKPLSYIDSSGSLQDIVWEHFVERLKKRLVCFILDDSVQDVIRSNLKLRFNVIGELAGCEADRGGNYIALYGKNSDAGFCQIRDTAYGNQLRAYEEKRPLCGALFSASPTLLTFDDEKIVVRDLLACEPEAKPKSKTVIEGIKLYTQSTDLLKVALGGDLFVIVIDARSLKIIFQNQPEVESKKILGLVFLAQYPIIVALRAGGLINFWNYETKKLLAVGEGHTNDVTKYHVHDGKIITVTDENHKIVWNCAEETDEQEVVVRKSGERAGDKRKPICFNEHGTKLLVTESRGGTILDILKEESDIPLIYSAALVDGCFVRDNLLATLGLNNRIVFWNPQEGTRFTQIHVDIPVKGLKSCFDGNCLVTMHPDDRAVTLWYYGNEAIVKYLRDELNFEQALLLYAWKGHEDVFNETSDLKKVGETLNRELLGKFLNFSK